ncbi:MAG: hypothetical protein QE272_11530 [Nevskia sp.]|nr:hypothetical protein [Nevskia sp.]
MPDIKTSRNTRHRSLRSIVNFQHGVFLWLQHQRGYSGSFPTGGSAMTGSLMGIPVDLGFTNGGVLSSRSIMLPELSALLSVAPADADMRGYQRLAVDEDALGKASAANREKTFGMLRRLYALNPEVPIFREFRRLSLLFPSERETMAGILALAREPLLRACSDMVLGAPINSPLSRESFEVWVREFAAGRFSEAMYRSFSHNLYASFFQMGYLGEAVAKCRLRQRRDIRPATVAYAAFLDWLKGLNGVSLLQGSFSRSLELAKADHLSLLSAAGQLGLMQVANSGGVLQLDFASWLQPGEARLST